MYLMGINLWSVLVAAIATMVVGFLWYSPLMFARPWMVLMGYDREDKAKLEEMRKGAGKMYGISFVASLVSAGVLAKIIVITTVSSALYGMKVGLAVWLGFVATVQLTSVLFARQPVKLYLDQHRLSISVLPGDGGDFGHLAVVIQRIRLSSLSEVEASLSPQ